MASSHRTGYHRGPYGFAHGTFGFGLRPRTRPRRSNGNGVTLYSSNQNEREASPTREGFLIGLPNHVAI
jgi:hypothetical protein